MKRKDIGTILIVAFISVVFSLILSDKLFDDPADRKTEVEVVQPISSEFPTPSTDTRFKKYFNDQSINPTKLIQIGDGSNNNPFNDEQ